MKCRQCGNSFHNGLICPLCGHKNMGQIHCQVCGKRIHYGQGHCPSCGTPTQYCKKGEVVVNGAIIDYTVHSAASHTYDQQEQYDYKKNAYQYNQGNKDKKDKQEPLYKEQYDYKKDAYQYNQTENTKKKNTGPTWLEIVKEKQAERQQTVRKNTPYSTKMTGATGNIIAGIVILVLIVSFCVAALLPDTQEDVSVAMDYSNNSVENLPIVGTNNALIEQANVANGQWSWLYGEQLYVTQDLMYTINKDFIGSLTTNETIASYIYGDDTQMYYLDDRGVLSHQNINTKEETILLEDITEAGYLEGSLYYLKTGDTKTLYQYTIAKQQTTILTNQYNSTLRLDTTTNTLYYLDINSNLMAISNLSSMQKNYHQYDLRVTNFLVEGNTLYTYKDNDGFLVYDLQSQQEIGSTSYDDVKQYTRVTDGYLCLKYDGSVSKVFDDGSTLPILSEGMSFVEMQVAGDKILLKEEDYGESILYIASENGDLARIIDN